MKFTPCAFMLQVCFLLLSFKKVSAILCYDCNSAYDPRCGVEFDSFSLGVVNCSLKDPPDHVEVPEPTICRTIKMEIKNKVRVVRQCGYLTEDNEKPCRRQTGTGELFVTYCSCNTDLCNAASHNKMAFVLTVLTVAVNTLI